MGYGMYEYADMMSEAFRSFSLVGGIVNAIGSLFSVAIYLLLSMGLYTLAQRRQIKNPWLAFLPLVNLWILGSISDQYQYVQKAAVCNRRKWLIVLSVIHGVLWSFMIVALFSSFFSVITYLKQYGYDAMDYVIPAVLGRLLLPLGIGCLCAIASLVLQILQWVCYYDLFASCDPGNKVLYLVLGILFPFLMSIFVFICRDKEMGMPPRREVLPPVDAE